MADERRSFGKRPLSAFLMFCCEKRKEIHQEKMSLSDSTRILSKRWKTMTDEEKKPFVEKSTKDKERYHKQQKEQSQMGGLKRKRSTPQSNKKAKRSRLSDKDPGKGGDGANVAVANDVVTPVMRSSSLQNAYLPGVDIPIFTEEFLQYNKKVNSELLKYRQVNKHLIDQRQRLEDTIQAIDLDIVRVGKLVEERASSNKRLDMELQVLRKLVLDVLAPGDCHSLTPEELLDQVILRGGDNDIRHLIDELSKHYSN